MLFIVNQELKDPGYAQMHTSHCFVVGLSWFVLTSPCSQTVSGSLLSVFVNDKKPPFNTDRSFAN